MSQLYADTVPKMAREAEETDFTADGKSGLQRSQTFGESGLLMCLHPSFLPFLNIRAMLIAWCSDIWKFPSGGQITKAFRTFEAVTPTLQR